MLKKKVHQAFMSTTPWGIPLRRSGSQALPNLYDDFQFWADLTTWPDNARLMDQGTHPEYFEHAYWLTAGEKTEMTNEWIKTWQATYGGIVYNISTAGAWTGYYIVHHGRYVPSEVYAGRTTNTADFTKYDGMRGFLWDYWTNSNPSDQHNFQIAERPTRGSSNFGAIYLSVDRSYTSKWRINVVDGDGGSTHTYLAGVPDCAIDSCALQWEFVKGSHIKLKMYINVASALNFSTFTPPTWPMAETGYYATVSLSSSPLNQFVPISPLVVSASSVESSNGRLARYAYEIRAAGHSWEYLT